MADLIGNRGARVRTKIGLLALGLAALVGFGIGAAAMMPRSTGASTARACTRIVATLLATQNAVELERSRYLVAELGCSVRGALPVLGAAADAGTGRAHAGPPRPLMTWATCSSPSCGVSRCPWPSPSLSRGC